MTVLNASGEDRALGLARFQERTEGYASARDVVTGEAHALDAETLAVPARTALVLELTR